MGELHLVRIELKIPTVAELELWGRLLPAAICSNACRPTPAPTPAPTLPNSFGRDDEHAARRCTAPTVAT
eukprot:NODE_10719_length_298_cov_140.477366.p4 GENE.NODE_10719_length_298_cov_140.477366~~NODE_10719_length_298_cov_140.477366.p4  ORF type:complete len:70 (+),score=16.87 NODE_10719_length_298_cov_140.477366:3-212(+)